MPKTLRRTLSVLLAVAVTTVGVYGAVRVAGAFLPSGSVIASAEARVQVCPATGCTATSCHGATGVAPPTNRIAASAQSNAATQSSAAPNAGAGSASAVTYVCPVTGCTATSCHGATGAPPPQRAGQRQHGSSDD